MNYKLEKYEQDIEENLQHQDSIATGDMLKSFQKAAQVHLKDKKPVTIRISQHDIEAIKIKASKLGLPYQTYINMLLHKEATRI